MHISIMLSRIIVQPALLAAVTDGPDRNGHLEAKNEPDPVFIAWVAWANLFARGGWRNTGQLRLPMAAIQRLVPAIRSVGNEKVRPIA